MDSMDDDFGELYADVEMQASSAIGALYTEPEDNDPTNGAKSTDADEKSVPDSVVEDSDSDDDLNIVLNDDDCDKFPVSGGGYDEDENDDFVKDETGSDKTSRRVKPAGDESKLNSGGSGVERGTVAKIGFNSHSHYKYVRTPGSSFPSNMRINGCNGVSSFSSMSMSGRGDPKDDFYKQKRGGSLVQVANRHAISSSIPHQFGYCFSLPWYRTIFDVNIDAFEEKPWRHPGIDLTDFFNFGFNEDSWKQYCNSLAHEAEAGHEAATQEAMSDYVAKFEASFKCADGGEMPLELPKGRAIQVEDSIDERQPSMDLRHPRFQDSDVIIQITLQDSTVDSSDSAKDELGHGSKFEMSESRKLDAEYDTDVRFSVSPSSDDQSGEHAMVRNVSTSFSPRRSLQRTTASNQTLLENNNYGNDKLPDMNGGCHANMDVCSSEAMETKIKEHEVPCRNANQSNPCIVEKETSFENRSHFSSMLSFSECYFEENSENSVHAFSIEDVASPSRSQSLSYDAELSKSVVSNDKSSRSGGPKTKSDDGEGYSIHLSTIRDKQKHGQRHSEKQRMLLDNEIGTLPLSDTKDDRKRYPRHRDPFEAGRKHRYGRPNGITDLRIYAKNCNDASHLSNTQELYENDYSSIYCGRQRKGPQDHDSHGRDNSSYYRERPCADSYKRFADRHSPAARIEDHLSSKEESNQFVRKSWNGKEFHRERRVGKDKEDEINWFWHHGQRLPAHHHSTLHTYRESGRLISRYSSSSKQKGIQWRRENGRLQLRKKTGHDYCQLDDKHEYEWLKEQYGRSIPFAHCERDMIEPNERLLPPIRREVKVFGRKGRYADAAYFHLERSWPMETDNEYQRHMYSKSLALASDREPPIPNRRRWSNNVASRKEAYDSKLIEKYNRHVRMVCHEEERDSGWFGYYDCSDDDEDIILQNYNQVQSWRRGHSQRSRLLHWREDKPHVNDRLFAPEVSFSREKTSRHERIHARHRSLQDELHIDDLMLKHHGYEMTSKKSNANADRLKRNSIVRYRGECEQKVLKDRDSVDLIIGEGKSSGRHSDGRSLIYDGRLEKIGLEFPKEQKSSRTFNDSCGGKAVKTDIPSMDGGRNNEKQLYTFPAKECNQDLDIEEGQIICEEQSIEGINLEKEDASETMIQRGKEKMRTVHENNASDGNRTVVEYDNKRMQETLAKMEKRRERFKDSITIKREPGKTSQPQVKLVLDTDAIKHGRPARKRQWGMAMLAREKD